jgi:hypothetical protein
MVQFPGLTKVPALGFVALTRTGDKSKTATLYLNEHGGRPSSGNLRGGSLRDCLA